MSNMANGSKNVKKYQNIPTGTHTKSQILLTRFTEGYRGKEVPINKESIKKAREAINLIVDT